MMPQSKNSNVGRRQQASKPASSLYANCHAAHVSGVADGNTMPGARTHPYTGHSMGLIGLCPKSVHRIMGESLRQTRHLAAINTTVDIRDLCAFAQNP